MNDAQLIEALGGPAAVARLLEIRVPSVSGWKKIPTERKIRLAVIAQNGSYEATFKKYRVIGYDEYGREEFELVPLNPDYPTLSSRDHKISIIGVMVRHERCYK